MPPQVHPNWHLNFQVPTSFSSSTENAISTGILLKKHRIEIIQAVAMAIIVNTKELDYDKVCEKLIHTHPTLKDELELSGYVSIVY